MCPAPGLTFSGCSVSNSELQIPFSPGSYLLVLYLRCRTKITIGRLGTFSFKRGWYCYSGSAFGPGGLKARLGHHLKPISGYHWHIDYLRTQAELRSIWCLEGVNNEHLWSAILSKADRAIFPVAGFGSSDCKCNSHLVYLPSCPKPTAIRMLLGAASGLTHLHVGK
jgi:Uri superfamily endonuclease